MEEVMRSYKINRNAFTNFYGIAFLSNIVTYLAGILFAVLIIKVIFMVIIFFICAVNVTD